MRIPVRVGTVVVPVTLAPIGEVGGFAEDPDILATAPEERGEYEVSGAIGLFSDRGSGTYSGP